MNTGRDRIVIDIEKGRRILMQENHKLNRIKNILMIISIAILCIATILLDILSIKYVSDEFMNRMIGKTIQQSCGLGAAVLLMIKTDIKLFAKPQSVFTKIQAMTKFPLFLFRSAIIRRYAS